MDRHPVYKDNDTDSIIYVSDNSNASIIELETTQKGSIASIVLDSSSEEDEDTDHDGLPEPYTIGDVILQEEKFIVSETVEEMQEVIKKYEDKATQTYNNEFPTQSSDQTVTPGATINVPISKEVNLGPGQQSSLMASGSVPTNITTSDTSTRTTNHSSGSNENLATREKSPVRNNISRIRRTYTHRKSYKNCRIQPYRCYNSNYKRYNNNYDGNNNRLNYSTYGNTHSNNSYNYNNDFNRFDFIHNNNNNSYYYNYHKNVKWYHSQYFRNQFKERLFRGFIDLMDYVFDYNYS